MLFAVLLALCATVIQVISANSTPVATSTIISKITSEVLSTSSSIIGTSTSTSTFESCSTTTDTTGNSSAECKAGQALSVSTIYSSKIVTFTSVYETTGYSTIYSNIKDVTTTPITDSDTDSKVSTTHVPTSTTTNSDSRSTTSTTLTSETRQSSTTTSEKSTTSAGSSSTSAKSSQTSAVSGSQTSTADLSQSSSTADDGQGLSSTAIKALVAAIILALIALGFGIAYFVVKRRRARKAQQTLLGKRAKKNDIEKTEMQVLINRPTSEVMYEKTGLYPETPRSTSDRSSVYTMASFEMSAETRPSSFYGAQSTQKYEMVATTTPVFELDSGDYEFKGTER